MTQEQIDYQIEVIDRAAKKALRSKKASLQFLIEAGIIPDIIPYPEKKKVTKKKK